MYCFCGMVDRRKTLSFFSSQDHCQKFLTYPNLWHAASRFCTWAEPKLKFWWIKLYSSNNYCTRWPHRVFWAAINIKRAHSCNILILVSTLLLSNIHTYGLYVRYGIMNLARITYFFLNYLRKLTMGWGYLRSKVLKVWQKTLSSKYAEELRTVYCLWRNLFDEKYIKFTVEKKQLLSGNLQSAETQCPRKAIIFLWLRLAMHKRKISLKSSKYQREQIKS